MVIWTPYRNLTNEELMDRVERRYHEDPLLAELGQRFEALPKPLIHRAVQALPTKPAASQLQGIK